MFEVVDAVAVELRRSPLCRKSLMPDVMLLSRPTPVDEEACSRDELSCVRGEVDHCS